LLALATISYFIQIHSQVSESCPNIIKRGKWWMKSKWEFNSLFPLSWMSSFTVHMTLQFAIDFTHPLTRMHFEVHVTVQIRCRIFVQASRYVCKGESDSSSNPGTKDVSVKRLGFGTQPMQTLRLKTALRNVKRVLPAPFLSRST
jgi:hypothetical protein